MFYSSGVANREIAELVAEANYYLPLRGLLTAPELRSSGP